MDPRLLNYYNRELQFIREMSAEFAAEYPKVARRLDINGTDVSDPYVERLLEGFAFLAARVQLQLDASFPRFTQYLLELVYPNYLAPIPSMLVAQLNIDPADAGLAKGAKIARGSALNSILGPEDTTVCDYRTGQEVTLWPVAIEAVDYFSSPGALVSTGLTDIGKARAGLRIRLKTTGDLAFNQIGMDTLSLYFKGQDDLPRRLYEQVVGNSLGFAVKPKGSSTSWAAKRFPGDIRRRGMDNGEELLPEVRHGFKGYRLLQEYFAFPERFLFVDLCNLNSILSGYDGSELDIIVLLDRSDPVLDDRVSADNVALHCVPAVNLFEKRTSRVSLDDRNSEHHLVPDRTKPMDFEVHSIRKLLGFERGSVEEVPFPPFYSANDAGRNDAEQVYYVHYREPRLLSQKQRRDGPRSGYIGSEVFVSLVDGHDQPSGANVQQLEAVALCTNRDLPLTLKFGSGPTDLTLDAPVFPQSIRVVAGPTRPVRSRADGDVAWRLISQLSLNYLSIVDADGSDRGGALRELLSLYADHRDAGVRKQLEGIVSVTSRPITRRIPVAGPVTYGRGIQINVECDDSAYEGSGVFLLGAVLEEFFARYASINSFTETVISTPGRGEVMRWPARLGRRQTL